MQSLKDVDEQLRVLKLIYGEPAFKKHFINSRSKQTIYFFMINATNGVAYDDNHGDLSPITVDPETGMFDSWTEGHFVHLGEEYFNMWRQWSNKEVEQELLGDDDFKLPEGFREAMEQTVVDNIAEGMNYSGYFYERAQEEVGEMSDKDVYDHYYDINYGCDATSNMIEIVEDILNKEKLEEVIDE